MYVSIDLAEHVVVLKKEEGKGGIQLYLLNKCGEQIDHTVLHAVKLVNAVRLVVGEQTIRETINGITE